MLTDSSPNSGMKCGYVAIVGHPNVGKSTLLNCILGQKLSITSNRPQTTRNRLLGVRTIGKTQLILIDTPGVHRAQKAFNRLLVREALAALSEIDIVLWVVECSKSMRTESHSVTGEQHHLETVLREHIGPKTPIVVALNKIDRVADHSDLLPQLADWQARGFDRVVPISALRDDGVDRVIDELAKIAPESAHLYPEDMLTDRAERWLAGELIREQVLRRCEQEVPHAAAVEVEAYTERPDRGDVVISATIWLERNSQKAIVVGSGGKMISAIGSAARKSISRLIGCPTHIRLTVRVAECWRDRPSDRKRFGYEE